MFDTDHFENTSQTHKLKLKLTKFIKDIEDYFYLDNTGSLNLRYHGDTLYKQSFASGGVSNDQIIVRLKDKGGLKANEGISIDFKDTDFVIDSTGTDEGKLQIKTQTNGGIKVSNVAQKTGLYLDYKDTHFRIVHSRIINSITCTLYSYCSTSKCYTSMVYTIISIY